MANVTVQLGHVKFVPCVSSVEHIYVVGNGVPGWNTVALELDEGLDHFRSLKKNFWA